MNEQQTAAPVKCTYCSKPVEKVVKREIHDRSRDPYTNRPCVRTRTMEFCSAECGGRYQMGCEG